MDILPAFFYKEIHEISIGFDCVLRMSIFMRCLPFKRTLLWVELHSVERVSVSDRIHYYLIIRSLLNIEYIETKIYESNAPVLTKLSTVWSGHYEDRIVLLKCNDVLLVPNISFEQQNFPLNINAKKYTVRLAKCQLLFLKTYGKAIQDNRYLTTNTIPGI